MEEEKVAKKGSENKKKPTYLLRQFRDLPAIIPLKKMAVSNSQAVQEDRKEAYELREVKDQTSPDNEARVEGNKKLQTSKKPESLSYNLTSQKDQQKLIEQSTLIDVCKV